MSAVDTPMMRQYLELKAQVPDALLLYRMGDFYECFFDDAKEASALLELTLTSRNKNDPDPIPMAGVPWHQLDNYLKRLAESGRKVAVADQVEPPGQGGLVERRLVRVVTPGVPWDADSLESREPCFLAGVVGTGPVGLAFLDVSTGVLRVTETADLDAAAAELQRAEAREVVLDPVAAEEPGLRAALGPVPTATPDPAWFDRAAARATLTGLLGTADLVGFGAEELGPALQAAGAIVTYARQEALVDLSHVRTLEAYSVGGHMVLDEATRRNLEILRPLRGVGRKGTLLWLLDRTRTAMGGRLLREWVTMPLADPRAVNRRLDAVEALLDNRSRRQVRERLALVADVERLTGKATQGTANARDLVALAASLGAVPGVVQLLSGLAPLRDHLPQDLCEDVAADVTRWLVDEPPASTTEGGLIRRGLDPQLDELVDLAHEGKGAMARMEARERERTGISTLRIKHNNVFGYFLEVTAANVHKVPADWYRKQTLANAERYVTEELKAFEQQVLGANDKRKALEYEHFVALRGRVAAQVERLQQLARAVATIDVFAGLADLAVDQRYVRPEVDATRIIDIKDGRHPVVEAMGLDERFVPNDIRLDDRKRLVILTGPNMAGKSTVMRQLALIVLMAQVGSFVPASRARVGLCDRVFVRVGASDDLAHGRSTFMVEMSETALILNQATARSLVLLDEIGRGTSTYDGMAIAWAVAEALHDRLGARAVFATHYHELVALADEKSRVANLHVAVSEWGERIIFLRTLKEGGASKSYGIQCARLAGMPGPVVERARELLRELERRPRHGPPTQQLSLFAPADPPEPDALRLALDAIDPNALTPMQALEALFHLKVVAQKSIENQ